MTTSNLAIRIRGWPEALRNLPPTYRLVPSVARARTVSSTVPAQEVSSSPVLNENAARYGRSILVLSVLTTLWNVPPTNIVSPATAVAKTVPVTPYPGWGALSS